MTAIICTFSEPEDYRITDGTRVWFFDWSDRFGPSLTNGKGDILANPWPSERSAFWRCFRLWHDQGKRWELTEIKGVRVALWDEPPAGRYVVDARGVIISSDEPTHFHERYSAKIYVDQNGEPYSFPRLRRRQALIINLKGSF